VVIGVVVIYVAPVSTCEHLWSPDDVLCLT